MSWFNHVNQASFQPQQQQEPSEGHRLNPNSEGSPSTATQPWTGFSGSPSPEDFPSAPRGVVNPPSLEKLSCSSPSAGHVGDPEPISYVSLQEQRCVLSWYKGWTSTQRERFLQDLLGKAVPGKVCTLLDSLSTLQVLPPLLRRQGRKRFN